MDAVARFLVYLGYGRERLLDIYSDKASNGCKKELAGKGSSQLGSAKSPRLACIAGLLVSMHVISQM